MFNLFSNDFAQKKLHKKASYSGYRLSLLVFLHKSSLKGSRLCVQSPQGYAHFFGRLPRKIPVKNNFFGWQSSKKIERKIKDLSGKFRQNRNARAFLENIIDKKMKSFFFN
jgi:hypothetical protein